MGATLTLFDLAGAVALLIWGVHMVQTGITRAFGPQLRRILGYALGSRFRAFLAGLGRDVDPAEQHGHGADGDGIRGRRACRPRPGAGRDAGRQCRHHADRASAVIRCVAGFVPAHPDRRVHLPAQRRDPHTRPRPRGDRAWSDADRASASLHDDHSLRGCTEPADAARRGHDRPADRYSARRRIDLGSAFERCRRFVDHGLCRPSGRAAARRVCPCARGQPRHSSEPAARKRRRRRPRR